MILNLALTLGAASADAGQRPAGRVPGHGPALPAGHPLGGPRVDNLYSGFEEVLDVPRRQGCPVGPADGCNLGVEALDWQAQAGPSDHHRPEPAGRSGIKWLDEITKRGEEVRGCR